MTDFDFDELDYRLNNPVYPTNPCAGLNPLDIFKAPDGHIYTPEEMSTIVSGNAVNPANPFPELNPLDIFKAPDGHIYTPEEMANMAGITPAPSASSVNPDMNNVTIGQKTIEADPNGGVIVTDIIGGKHHFVDMDQAMRLTDIMSGFPISDFNTNPVTPTENSTSHHCPNYPTDVHTPVNLTFYDNEIDKAHSKLIEAEKEIANSDDPDKVKDAIRKAEDAKSSIRYWEDCRRTEDYNQTIDNIKSDKITNDVNKALNDLHETLHHR